METKRVSMMAMFLTSIACIVQLIGLTAYAQDPVYSDIKNHEICHIKIKMDVSRLKLPICQWAVVEFDPMPDLRKRISELKVWYPNWINGEKDAKKRAEIRNVIIANVWDDGFQYVQGNDLIQYAEGPGINNYYNTGATGKFWFITKTGAEPNPLLCWAIPLDMMPGQQIDIRLTRSNALDIAGIFDEIMAQETAAKTIKTNPLHDTMIAALHSAQTLYYETAVTHSYSEIGVDTFKVWLKKPNYARIEFAENGKLHGVLVGDGENFWIYWPEKRPFWSGESEAAYESTKMNRYMRLDATPGMHSIWHLIPKIGHGLTAFQPSYFHKCPFAVDATIDSIINQGTEKIGDEEFDVIEISLMNHQRSRFYWLSREDHLPRRVRDVIRIKQENWNEENWLTVAVNEEIPDSLFAWKPPDGWVEYIEPSTEMRLLPTGTPAPDFSFKTLDNREFKLSDQKGKVVLINFWRVGCPPCREELPWLEKMHQTYKDKGLVVVGYNASDNEKYVRGLLDSNNVTYPNILDTSEAASQIQFEKYQQKGMSAVPLNYLIDRQGNVIRAWYGYGENHDLTIKQIMDEK